jgi:DNA polymerase-3 subunit beta
MEFTVNKTDLVRELNLSQGVVEKKTTIPILSNVLIEAEGERIVLTATDLELGIRCSCAAEVKRAGAGTLPARRLLEYVRLLPDAAIQVKFAENHWASLVCGRSRTRIAGMSRESFPELPEMPAPLAELPVGLLTSLISKTIFAISAEESRFTLNGALLVLRPGKLTMVATDGHRLALCEDSMDFNSDAQPYRALVPKKAMAELLKLVQELEPESRVEFSGNENHLFFRAGERRLLLSRKLTGNFPDYERVLPAEQPHHISISRDEFRSTIERVSQFSDERSHAIRFQFMPGEVRLYSSLSDTGETEENLPVEYEGPRIEVGFNAHYIGEFLRVINEPKVLLGFRDAASAGELRPSGDVEKETYRYVVMPMRL